MPRGNHGWKLFSSRAKQLVAHHAQSLVDDLERRVMLNGVASLPLTVGTSNKLAIGAFSPGQSITLAATGQGDVVDSRYQTLPDGELAAPATGAFSFANNGAVYQALYGGDGLNHFVGGGANYDFTGSGFPFAGKQTTDTTDPGDVRFGTIVGTFAANPARADWFVVGDGTTVTVPAGDSELYLAVNDTANSDNHGTYTVQITAPTSTVTWTGGAGNNQWTTAANWSSNPAFPGANDDVTINAAGNPAIDLPSGIQSVHSLISDNVLYLNGGTLQVATTIQLAANLILFSGSLVGSTVSSTDGAAIELSTYGGTLDGVTANTNIDGASEGGVVQIDDGLTVNGSLLVGDSAGSYAASLLFGDATHAAGNLGGTGTVVFGASSSNSIANNSNLSGNAGILSIGSGITMDGRNGSVVNDFSTDVIFNTGTVNANISGGTILLGSAKGTVTNYGSIAATNGASLTITNLVNESGETVTATSSTLTLAGSLNNAGTITITNSNLFLAGDFSQANMGTVVRTGGTVTVTGVIEGNVVLNASTGSWVLNGGVLSGSTINETGGAALIFGGSTGGLADATVNGSLHVVSGTLTTWGTFTVNGFLFVGDNTNAGTIVFLSEDPNGYGGSGGGASGRSSPVSGNPGSPVVANGMIPVAPAKIEGTGTIIFGSRTGTGNAIVNATAQVTSSSDPYAVDFGGAYYAGGSLTIGSGITITGGGDPFNGAAGGIYNGIDGGSITNDGTIDPDGSDHALQVGNPDKNGVQPDHVYNDGTIEATDGAELILGGLINAASVQVSGGSYLFLTGLIQNNGMISVTDSSAINLNCVNFTQAQLGQFSTLGATVEVSGQLNGGLTLNASTGTWLLEGGTVNGGTINEQDGSELAFTYYGGKLIGVIVNGIMDLDQGLNLPVQSSASVNVWNGLTLNGTMFLGNLQGNSYGSIYFGTNVNIPGTFGGNGTVVFGGGGTSGDTIYNAWQGTTTQALTFGPNIFIQVDDGSIGQYQANDPIIIQGTLNDDVAGGLLDLGSYSVINQGTLSATNGGNLYITGVTNTLGHTISAVNSTISLVGAWINSGTINAANSTLNLGGTFSRATLGSFVRTGGTVNITGTLTGGVSLNALTGSWTLHGGTIQGGIINATGGSDLILNLYGGKLIDVTVDGNIDGSQGSNTAYIFGGLVLNGTLTMGNATGSASCVLYFGDGYSQAAYGLTGNATVIMSNGGSNDIYNLSPFSGTLGIFTIGPDVTISADTGAFLSEAGTASIVNLGTIDADTAGGALQIGNGIGSFINQGTMLANGGTILLQELFTLSGQGTLSSTWSGGIVDGVFYSVGDILGNSTGAAGSDLAGTALFQGASSAADPFLLEAMSDDLGDNAAGFTHNFVFGSLTIATGFVTLVDQYHNAPGSGAEALYVNSLVVTNGDTLNLNGLHVYARAAQLDGTVVNGSVSLYPDGGRLPLDAPLPGSISTSGETDSWTFFGHAGQVITTYVNPGAGSAPVPISPNLNWAGVTLLGPANQVLGSGASTYTGGPVSLNSIVLPTTGTYTIEVNAAASRPTSTGYYVLAAFDVTPRISTMALGENETGPILTPFDVQQWTFSALAGEQVKFHLINESSSGLIYTLTGPNAFTGFSNITGDSALVNLTSTGTYTLTAQGTNGAIGNYAFVINPTTQTSIPLNGSVNQTLAGSGQAELFTINVPSVQTLAVNLVDNSSADSNEMYLRFGSAPTRETYDYRYSNADSANQTILVPSAAIGTWYVLIYADNVPAPSTYSLAANGYSLRLTGSFPAALGNSAPVTMSITGAGFQPGTTAELVGPGGTHIATTTTVVSFTQLYANFPAGLPVGLYSITVIKGAFTDSLSGAFTVSAGGEADLQTALDIPQALGRHIGGTLYVTYSNAGTVAMPAPLLTLGSTDPEQVPLLTLDASLISQGLRTTTVPPGYSTIIQILASGRIPGVLEPGESIKIPVYYAGLLQPWDTSDTSVPLNLGVIYATDTGTVDWSSYKSQLAPADVPAIAWNQIFANLTSQLGTTWGGYVNAMDSNASYLGGLGENVNDVNALWNFMYLQADDAQGPVEHLNTVFDSNLPLPDGNSLSFWRNYHLAISGRDAFGIMGYGWSVPYQSSLTFESDGTVDLNTVGEDTSSFLVDTRGGYFPDSDGNTLILNADGTYTVLTASANGESDTYTASGQLSFHTDTGGDVITYSYNSTGQLLGLTAATGQSITLTYNSAGLVSTLSDSQGNLTTYRYDSGNQYLLSETNFAGTTTYGYDTTTHWLTSIQNVDGGYSDIGYDATGRLSTLASATTSSILSYPQPGEISATDSLGNIVSEFYNENDQVAKSIDALGTPTYFTYDSSGNLVQMTNATGNFFTYAYDSSGNLTRSTDPLGHSTSYTYNANGQTTSITDANNNVTTYGFDASGNVSTITYPDGSQESVSLNSQNQPVSMTQPDGNAIAYTYDAAGDIASETCADGSQYSYTYNKYGSLLTATDASGTTTFTYDSTGRTTSVSYPNHTSLTYTYDAEGRPSTIVDQTGYTISYVYNSVGEPSEMVDGSGKVIAAYTYDAGGHLTQQNNSNGTYSTTSYNADGSALHVINYVPGGTVNSRFDYTYNNLDQMIGMSTLDGAWSYSYDAGGQLVRAVFTSVNPAIPNQDLAYNYDAVGNRVSTVINGVTTSYVANSMDQYTSIGGTLQQYDANGNLIFDGTSTYTYDDLNDLVGISNASGTSQFTYNALGQRISSTVNGQTTQFLNDSAGSGAVVAEYDGMGSLLTHFNYGPSGLVSQTTAAGANYFYDSDELGSISGLSNSAGTYADQYSYLPFGESLSSSGSLANPFQYLGGIGVLTDTSDQLHMGAREYAPSTGVFNSTDPLQNLAGNSDFYTYAFNQPTQVVDPSGLDSVNGAYWDLVSGTYFILKDKIADPLKETLTDAEDDEGLWSEALGPIYETVVDTVKDIIWNQELPSLSQIGDTFADKIFDKLNVGPFQIGLIEKTLLQPEFAVNVVNGINGIRRSGLCGTSNAGEAEALLEIGEAPPGCADAPGLVRPQVPTNAGKVAQTNIASSLDPNDKIGPTGFGSSDFVADGSTLPYRIDFENSSAASAPAQQVVITDQLSSNDDLGTFRITEIGWGDTVITVPANSQHYQTTVSMTYNGTTFNVLVQVGLNLLTGLMTAQFYSLDPDTDLPPDVLVGFLPPEDGTGRGMGYVSYVIATKPNLPTGTQIRNVADVSFDEQEIIATDQVSETDPTQGTDPTKEALVTIDAVAPTSTVAALPADSGTAITVNWSGQDDTGGSGIAGYNIFVSVDGAAFTEWLANATATSSIYTGQNGHTYSFYSTAVDNVGNLQATPSSAQASTTVGSGSPLILSGPAFYLRLDPDGQHVDVWQNSTGTNPLFEQVMLNAVSHVSDTGGTLVVDFSAGDPLPPSGASFAGNTLEVIGSGGNDVVSATSSQIVFNGTPISFGTRGQLILSEGNGTDTLNVQSGSLTLAAASNASSPAVRAFSSITIGTGASLVVSDAGTHAGRTVLNVGTLSIAGVSNHWLSTLDLGGNDMAVQIGDLGTLNNQVGEGAILSSTAASDPAHLKALGTILNNADGVHPLFNSLNPFDGLSPSLNSILIKFTYIGDANLNGAVDGSDYSNIDNGYSQHLTGWSNGDFNYDGVIDGSDYTLIDNAFNTQSTTLAASISNTATPSFEIASRVATMRRSSAAIGTMHKPAVTKTPTRPMTAPVAPTAIEIITSIAFSEKSVEGIENLMQTKDVVDSLYSNPSLAKRWAH